MLLNSLINTSYGSSSNLIRSVLIPAQTCHSLTPMWVLQARDMPELSELFIDPITEKQKSSKDDMAISTSWGTAHILHHVCSVKVSSTSVPVPHFHSTCLEALPVAVGGQGAQQEQEDQHCYAHCNGDVPHLNPLGVLLLPPLQIAELAPLPDVARHTAAKRK